MKTKTQTKQKQSVLAFRFMLGRIRCPGAQVFAELVSREVEAKGGSDEAVAVALLHEVHEKSSTYCYEMAEAGLSENVVAAVGIITHSHKGLRPYREHIEFVASVNSDAGKLARRVLKVVLAEKAKRSKGKVRQACLGARRHLTQLAIN